MMAVWEAQDCGGHGQEGLNAEVAFAGLFSLVRGVYVGLKALESLLYSLTLRTYLRLRVAGSGMRGYRKELN